MDCFIHSGVGTSAWATSCVFHPGAPDYLASGCVIGILWCRCFLLGLLAACYPCYCACLCPLYSKTYSALVWSHYAGATDWVLLVLLLHCAHFPPGCISCPGVLLGQCCCCSYLHANLATKCVWFTYLGVGPVIGATSWVVPTSLLQLPPACFLMHYVPFFWHGHLCWGQWLLPHTHLAPRLIYIYLFIDLHTLVWSRTFAGVTGWVLPWCCCCCPVPARLQV